MSISIWSLCRWVAMGTPSSQGNSSWVGSESGEGAIVEVIGARLVIGLKELFPLALGRISSR
ncbi:hypothetical protein [Microcystis aeruginosa]|uniref:hypothetical protein n=1 Tax=Microcystis aeruginosa TaxID=1126 RepID=UPI0018AD0F05